MSLRSGLTNEVDFAVNVCLLLSNEGRHVLKLTKSIHLLPLLMANIGIFDEGKGRLMVAVGTETDGDDCKFLEYQNSLCAACSWHRMGRALNK